MELETCVAFERVYLRGVQPDFHNTSEHLAAHDNKLAEGWSDMVLNYWKTPIWVAFWQATRDFNKLDDVRRLYIGTPELRIGETQHDLLRRLVYKWRAQPAYLLERCKDTPSQPVAALPKCETGAPRWPIPAALKECKSLLVFESHYCAEIGI